MENGSVPLKNGLIQQKSNIFKISFPEIPSERLGPGASFCVELNFPVCLIKMLLEKQKKRVSEIQWWRPGPRGPLHTRGKIQQKYAFSLRGKLIRR